MSLYHKYRPTSIKAVLGQDGAVSSFQELLSGDSHAILFTGPSGTGKTTLARIFKEHMKCGDADYSERNSADFRGVEDVREMRRAMNLSPISGECRIWLLDEVHKMTSDAQNALLKLLEDPPSHVYFLLATTDPQKLIRTVHTRCSEVKLNPLSPASLKVLVNRVGIKENFILSENVVDEIVEASDGSARKALVILEQVGKLKGEQAQLEAIRTTTFDKDAALDLARALVTNPRVSWPEVAKILRGLKDGEVESIRYCVLGYARACLVGGDTRGPSPKLGPQAYKVIDIFSSHMYDGKHAALAAACWEVLHG